MRARLVPLLCASALLLLAACSTSAPPAPAEAPTSAAAPLASAATPVAPDCYDACQKQMKTADVTEAQAVSVCRERCASPSKPTSAPPVAPASSAAPAAAAFDYDAFYKKEYDSCAASCSEASRKEPSAQDPEKTECEFTCDFGATASAEIFECRHKCSQEKQPDGSPKTAAACEDACNPDRVEEDEEPAP